MAHLIPPNMIVLGWYEGFQEQFRGFPITPRDASLSDSYSSDSCSFSCLQLYLGHTGILFNEIHCFNFIQLIKWLTYPICNPVMWLIDIVLKIDCCKTLFIPNNKTIYSIFAYIHIFVQQKFRNIYKTYTYIYIYIHIYISTKLIQHQREFCSVLNLLEKRNYNSNLV